MENEKSQKQKARDYLQDRVKNPKPLPDQETIRRQLGFKMIEKTRKVQK